MTTSLSRRPFMAAGLAAAAVAGLSSVAFAEESEPEKFFEKMTGLFPDAE